MDSAEFIKFVSVTVTMIFWLGLVTLTAFFSFKKMNKTEGSEKRQSFYIGISSLIIIIGDSLHTIGLDLAIITGDPSGSIGGFPVKNFAMFADDLAFMLFYLIWLLFIITRYQEGTLEFFDKLVIAIAIGAILTILPGAIPNFGEIYTMDYIISLYSIHNVLFIIFGTLTVVKLIYKSHQALHTNEESRTQELALFHVGISFIFSFVFFFLTLALLPLDPAFGSLMFPKTVAYVVSYILILKGVVLRS